MTSYLNNKTKKLNLFQKFDKWQTQLVCHHVWKHLHYLSNKEVKVCLSCLKRKSIWTTKG